MDRIKAVDRIRAVDRIKIDRRAFCAGGAAVAIGAAAARSLAAVSSSIVAAAPPAAEACALIDVAAVDRARVLREAERYVSAEPLTITSTHSARSSGGARDFYSEGDYWWPDPNHPGGPYIRRDGFTNPENFTAHREALLRLSLIVPALTAAWLLTKERRYAERAAAHLRAWFVAPATRMNPNLEHAQAIFGLNQGRGVGIIDTVHLVEPARAAGFLLRDGLFAKEEAKALRDWFAAYVLWMTTSKNGMDERDAKNNHGSCWALQVAAFAHLTGDAGLSQMCRERFKTILLPDQLAADGSLPLELARTKPYSYALFDLDILSTIAQILTQPLKQPPENLFIFTTPDGRGLRKAVAFMEPFIRDKKLWPYKLDVEFFDDLPVRQPSLLFAGLAFREPRYLALWKNLNADPMVGEIVRNYPIRQPLLWV